MSNDFGVSYDESRQSDFEGLSDFAFEGLSIASTTAGNGYSENASSTVRRVEDGQNAPLAVERFFEVCFDAGLKIYPEDDFERGHRLGEGDAMRVYKGLWREKSQIVAMKYFKCGFSDTSSKHGQEYQKVLEACMLELQVLSHERTMLHENIVGILGVSWQSNESGDSHNRTGISLYPILLVELACEAHPTLTHVMAQPLPLSLRLELLRDILEGLLAIHELSVVYGDIKPDNILIFESKTLKRITAKLSDFGYCQPGSNHRWEAGGTPYWNAPECLRGAPESLRVFARQNSRDIYTFGLLACFLVTRTLPFAGIRDSFEIARRKLADEVAPMITSLCDKDEWHATHELVPKKTTEQLPRLLNLEPRSRPSLLRVKDTLALYTEERRVTDVRRGESGILMTNIENTQNRRYAGRDGIGGPGAVDRLDPSTPTLLKSQMYCRLLAVATGNSENGKTEAMERLGNFFTLAFGTEQSMYDAFSWYCRAAERGSLEARKMVFRLERALKRTVIDIFPRVSHHIRRTWIVDCMFGTLKLENDSRIAPYGKNFSKIEAGMHDVLNNKCDANLVEYALARELDQSVVRLLAHNSRENVQEWLEVMTDTEEGRELFLAILNDQPERLDNALCVDTTTPMSIKQRLITAAADMGSIHAIRVLALKHHFDPDFVDAARGRTYPPLAVAALKNDVVVATALIKGGANMSSLLAHGTADRLIRIGTDEVAHFIFNALLSLNVNDINEEIFDGRNMCHQKLDGVRMAMCYGHEEDEIPPDNHNPPPLFEVIMYDRLDRVQSILARGGNPNIRYCGMTPLHLALKLLRPTVVIYLLAFGADPNARNSRNGYTTPLHELVENSFSMKTAGDADADEFTFYDFLMRPWEPLPKNQEEDDHHRRLILRIFLEYGARTDLLCADGFTPLMAAIVSPSGHSGRVLDTFLDEQISISDTSVRRETVYHLCIMAEDLSTLAKLLPLGKERLVNMPDLHGQTPLHLAAARDAMVDGIKMLLEAGGNILVRDKDGLTPLDTAMFEGQMSNFDALMDSVENMSQSQQINLVSANPYTARTALHMAMCVKSSIQATHFMNRLLSLPESVRSQLWGVDRWTMEPKDYARASGHMEAAKALEGPVKKEKKGLFSRMRRGQSQLNNDIMQAMDFSSSRTRTNAPLPAELAHIERCKIAVDNTGQAVDAKVAFTPTEVGYLKLVERHIQEKGDRSPQTLMCLNNLGTVYERYGRLSQAQAVYYRGWRLSTQGLEIPLSIASDFASKFLYVLKDRGIDDTQGHDVREWHAKKGKDTLHRAQIVWKCEHEHGGKPSVPVAIIGNEAATPRSCDRPQCSRSSTVQCHGCSFAQYCSSACRVDDIVDPTTQHLLVCLPTKPVQASNSTILSAIPTQNLSGFVSFWWTRINKVLAQPLNLTPTCSSAIVIKYNPAQFKTAVTYTVPSNSAIIYFGSERIKIRLSMREPLEWLEIEAIATIMAAESICVCVAPTGKLVADDPNLKEGKQEEDLMYILEFSEDITAAVDSVRSQSKGRDRRV